MERFVRLSFLLCILSLPTGLIAQVRLDKSPEAAKAYENRERALRLSLLKYRIANLEDAPMRCFLNTAILKFIAENKVSGQFDVAESAALSCLEDIFKNPDEFGDSRGLAEKSTVLGFARMVSPDFAKEVDRKYGGKEITKLTDVEEAGTAKDLTDLMARALQRIANGDVNDIYFLFDKIKLRDTAQSVVLLRALLAYFETTSDLSGSVGTLRMMSPYYLDGGIPVDLRITFYRFLVRLGENQMAQPVVTPLYEAASLILDASLPGIKTSIQDLESHAESISQTLRSRMSARQRESEEVYKRIEASDDKLAQTIAEAELAKDQFLKNSLWFSAAELAVKAKKFSRAVDCRLNYQPKKGSEFANDYFLLNDVIAGALQVKDMDSADYALRHMDGVFYRAEAEMKMASKYMSLADDTSVFERIQASIRILDKAERTTDSVRILLSAVPIALRLKNEKTGAFAITSKAIDSANHLDLVGSDQKVGSTLRVKYANGPLLWNAYNLSSAFRLLAKSDFGYASGVADEIKSKPWRLAVEIVLETEKRYPLPSDVAERTSQK